MLGDQQLHMSITKMSIYKKRKCKITNFNIYMKMNGEILNKENKYLKLDGKDNIK